MNNISTSTYAQNNNQKYPAILTNNEIVNKKHHMKSNWIHFNNKASEFSSSFKQKMEEALSIQLQSFFEGEIDDYNITLNVGNPIGHMDDNGVYSESDFVVNSEGKFCYATVQINPLPYKTYYLTIAWTSNDFENPLEIQSSNISNKKVDFFWCQDFPKDNIINDLNPFRFDDKSKTGYKFDVKYYLRTFPDVNIVFTFKTIPDKKCYDAVKSEVYNFKEKYKTVFVHDAEIRENKIIIPINHNTINYQNYGEKEYEKDISNFDFLIQHVNANLFIKNLEVLTFD